MFKEYTQYDAIGLAQLIKAGEVTSQEVLDAALHRANTLNPHLNAIIHRCDKRAVAQAQKGLPEGVFSGVPFLLKDLSFLLAGEPICMGSRGICYTPDNDSEIVKRMKATGVNTFGKTNTPEFGLIITTEPKVFGAAHNPHKQGYSTGGSSGGSAAAVASGIVPMAGAGDGGGSIRFPASWCGVFGLKPSRGRNPLGPDYGEGWSGAISDHVITKSVRDSAAMLDAIHGKEVGAPYHIAPPTGTFLAAARQAPKPLKIALASQPLISNTPLNPDVKHTLNETVEQLEAMGHIVEEANPKFNTAKLWQDFFVVVCAHTAWLCDDLTKKFGKKAAQGFEPATKNMAMLGRSFSAQQFVQAHQGWHDVSYQTGLLLQNYDLLLCPTVATPAVKHGVLPQRGLDELLMQATSGINIGKWVLASGLVEKLSHPVLSKMAFTILGNMTGLPAMSLPLGMSSHGLPIGMQFIGRMGDEETLLSLAGEFERAGLFTPLVLD